jgi:uncharacterized membrane protein YGL010W
LLALTLWRFELVGREISLALLASALAVIGWIALDLVIGIVLALMMLPAWFGAEALAGELGVPGTWTAFAALFIGGWAMQLFGHHFEGKKPALIDNLFQAFIGPMFLVAEIMIEMGYRRDLANVIGEGDYTT